MESTKKSTKQRKKTKDNKNFIEEIIYELKIKPDVNSHIKVNNDICRTCYGKECTQFCPTQVFYFSTKDEKLIVNYENCIECGACNIGCPYENIEYKHPKSGYGIME